MSERQSHGDPIEQGGHGMTLEVKKMPEQERPRYDLSTIVGIDVDNVKLPEEAEEMADAYLQELDKDKTNKASLAELAWAFRRQLQEDLRQVEADTSSAEEMSHKDKQGLTKRLRAKLLKTDESHAFSLALYRKLMERSGDTLQQELARHEQEKKEINGSYEVYKNLEKNLAERRGQLISLLSDMFHRAGQEPKPVHLAKRALLEAKVSELEDQLQAVKEKKPDVAALVEYDTIHSYAEQLRNNGFIWTKSRQELLQDVLTGALTSRPVAALMGETGTGKTAMARAASLELSSREPERTVGGDQEKFVRLLASPSIKAGETFYEYGPLLRALTGKSSSIDKDTSKGGGVFFDDEFNTRPTSVQRQILKFVSECRAGRQVAVPGTPLTVTVEPGFLYLAAGNPPSERYEREETGIETKREFAGNVLNVEYLEQTPDNPELYQILLATLLDSKTGRLTSVTPEEVEPGWVKDAATGEYHLNENERSGGFLYRFANCWSELNKAFSHQETVLTKLHPADQPNKRQLDSFILDPGVVISWLDQYKASPGDRKEHLAQFMAVKLDIYLKQFPEEEQKIVITYLEFFGLVPLPQSKDKISAKLLQKESGKPKAKVLTPKEIGYLNPNVPRPKEKGAPPKFEAIDVIDPVNGEVMLRYVAQEVLGQKPGAKFVRREVDARYPTTDIEVELLGWLFDEERDEVSTTEVVVKDREGKALVLSLRELRREYLPKREQQEGTSLERAKEILGEENVYGHAEVYHVFDIGFSEGEVPPIPYSEAQLEAGKKMGSMLVLRLAEFRKGKPMTAKHLYETVTPNLEAKNKGKLLNDIEWYENEAFYTDSAPGRGWRLVTRELLPGSTDLDYADQTKLLRDTLAAQPELTDEEKQAIADCSDAILDKIVNDNSWSIAAERLAKLKINEITRRKIVDVVYDQALMLLSRDKRLFDGRTLFDWTQDRASLGYLVLAGSPDALGLSVDRWHPGAHDDSVGVSFSR